MDTYKETFFTWNTIAKFYQDKFMDLDIYNDTYQILVESIPKKKAKVLEIGCGPGNISKYLLTQNPQLKLKGIDVSENMIQLAKKNNPIAEFEIMDGRKIHLLKDSFDAIVCGFCIPYFSNKDCIKLINDCNNLLNNSGILYLSFVEGDPSNSGFISGSSGARTYFYYHQLKSLKKVLKNYSFKIIDIFHKNYKKPNNINEIHTIIILKKVN